MTSMAPTSSKKEELDNAIIDAITIDGAFWSYGQRTAVRNLIKSELTQALKELKEEVIGEVPSKINTDNWKYDRRVVELKLWQHQAIDNKIKQLEEV